MQRQRISYKARKRKERKRRLENLFMYTVGILAGLVWIAIFLKIGQVLGS